MTSASLYAANLILISRLPLLFQDRGLPAMQIIIACAIQEIGLLALVPQGGLAVFAVCLLLTSALWWVVERSKQSALLARRLFLLVVYFILLGVFFSPAVGLAFRPGLSIGISRLAYYFFPMAELTKVNWIHFGSYSAGVLLCLSEANLVVRWLISALELRPQDVVKNSAAAVPPQTEYNRGRIIGLLERITLFALISLNQFTAIGFVVAAKALARFQSLDDRDFAEYFLVGTLASLVFAGTIALLVQRMMF
jgi:hypothetical protein